MIPRPGPALLALIAAGGAAGALARFFVGSWVHSWAGAGFPWGTLTVNVVGSLALGLAFRLFDALVLGPEVRGLVAIGFLGAFTTFSTFSLEAVALLQRGEWERAAAYVLGSVTLGLLGVWAGLSLGAGLFRSGA